MAERSDVDDDDDDEAFIKTRESWFLAEGKKTKNKLVHCHRAMISFKYVSYLYLVFSEVNDSLMAIYMICLFFVSVLSYAESYLLPAHPNCAGALSSPVRHL